MQDSIQVALPVHITQNIQLTTNSGIPIFQTLCNFANLYISQIKAHFPWWANMAFLLLTSWPQFL